MMRVILVRHGETIWNEEQRYQGASDPPLSERGELQARRLAARLASESIGLIYSSDSTRALQTADQIAAHHGRQVRADPRLREMDFGDWEGLTYSEIRERYPQALARWQGDPLATSPPGGESLAQLAMRVGDVLDDFPKLDQAETVLVVSHGGPLRVLLCLALGLAPADHW
ncbi:unnamed protein product, partial [marine sediment metagenome]